MAGGLGEPAGERESFLGGGGAAAATTASLAGASDPERETMPLGGGNSNSSSAANMRARRRWKEDGLAEPLEESPNGARGERNRSECERWREDSKLGGRAGPRCVCVRYVVSYTCVRKYKDCHYININIKALIMFTYILLGIRGSVFMMLLRLFW